MIEHSYQIAPRPTELGGGWRLRLIEDGEEVGALAEASAWVASRVDV